MLAGFLGSTHGTATPHAQRLLRVLGLVLLLLAASTGRAPSASASGASPPAQAMALGPTAAYLRGTAVAGSLVATILLGTYATPLRLVADPVDGNVYVAGVGNGNVTVISGTTNAVVGSIPISTVAFDIAFDSASGLLYTTACGPTCQVPGNVSIINASTRQVVGQIPVGSDASAIAYDSLNGNLYVANTGDGTVSVIAAASRTPLATVGVGSGPVGLAVNEANGNIYVANTGCNVSVISGVTNVVVANIPTICSPSAVAFDRANGNVYVAVEFSINTGVNDVVVISGATNTVVGTIPVGLYPRGIAYDSANGYLYVSELSDDTLTVIDGATDRVVATIPVGTGYGMQPIGVAYNPRNGNIYSANSHQGAVAVFATLASTTTPTSPRIDVGQTLLLSAPVTGSGAAIARVTTSVSPAAGLTCRADAPGLVEVSAACRGSAPGNYTVTLVANDTTGTSYGSSVTVQVASPPTITMPQAVPGSVDVGQAVAFSVVVSGGSGASSYAWTGLPPGCVSSNLPAVVCTPTAVGVFSVAVVFTDAYLASVTSAPLAFEVDPPPVLTLTVSASSVSEGGSVTFHATVTGGASGLTYTWSGLPSGCAAPAGPTLTCTPSAAGTFNVQVNVTDSNHVSDTKSVGLVVTASLLGGPLSLDLGLVVAGVAIAVAVAVGLLVLLRRRRPPSRVPPGNA